MVGWGADCKPDIRRAVLASPCFQGVSAYIASMHLPSEVPVMTLPSATLFPQALLPLYIFEPRYRHMLADMLRTNRMFTVAMQKPGTSRETPCTVAGLGLIRVSVDHEDGTSHLILQGLARVQLVGTVQTRPYRVAQIRALEPETKDSVEIDALLARVQELVEERLEHGPFPFPFSSFKAAPGSGKKKKGAKAEQFSPQEVLDYLKSLPDADQVADLVSCALLPGALERQALLETVPVAQRLRLLIHFLTEEIRRCREDSNS
jgi:Lon protease-like protein